MRKSKIIIAEFAVTAYSDGTIDWDRFDQFLYRVLARAGLLKNRPGRQAKARFRPRGR